MQSQPDNDRLDFEARVALYGLPAVNVYTRCHDTGLRDEASNKPCDIQAMSDTGLKIGLASIAQIEQLMFAVAFVVCKSCVCNSSQNSVLASQGRL